MIRPLRRAPGDVLLACFIGFLLLSVVSFVGALLWLDTPFGAKMGWLFVACGAVFVGVSIEMLERSQRR